MSNQAESDSGEGLASVIPFPLHRVSPAPDNPSVEGDTGQVREIGKQENMESETLAVEDLRERIKPLEATGPAPEMSPRAVTKETTRAKNIALHQLGVSGRSEAEVRERLVARDIAAEVIDDEVGRLIAVGLIDDRGLAENLVETLRGRKKLGDRAIEQTLRRRKICQETISEVLAVGDFDPDVAVFELARDRARSMRHLDPDVAFRRIVGFVQRRGYQGPQVFEAVRRAVNEAGDGS